jgi:hypothetical protein
MRNPYAAPGSLPYRFRQRRSKHIKKLLDAVLAEKGSCRIIDLGGTEQYWNIMSDYLIDREITIDLVNISEITINDPKFRSIVGSALEMDAFGDNEYDLVHSNSLIEHVGNWDAMMLLAQNIKRLAPRYFVQTPYFWFPYEPHFRFLCFHWMPEQFRVRLLRRMTLGFHERQQDFDLAMRTVQSAYLLDIAQFRALFEDATIVKEKLLFLTKSLMAIRA